jgi:hypothetical protein
VAAYLRGDAEEKPAGDRILERLTAAQPAEPSAAPVAKPAEPVNERKLEALTKATEPVLATPKADEPAKAAELEKANEKLASLLGKPK